jgi:hypothetical protein
VKWKAALGSGPVIFAPADSVKPPAVIQPPSPTPPDKPKPDPAPQVTPATPARSTLTKLVAAIFAAFFKRS